MNETDEREKFKKEFKLIGEEKTDDLLLVRIERIFDYMWSRIEAARKDKSSFKICSECYGEGMITVVRYGLGGDPEQDRENCNRCQCTGIMTRDEFEKHQKKFADDKSARADFNDLPF